MGRPPRKALIRKNLGQPPNDVTSAFDLPFAEVACQPTRPLSLVHWNLVTIDIAAEMGLKISSP